MKDNIVFIIIVIAVAVAQLVTLLGNDEDCNGYGSINKKTHVKFRQRRTMRSIMAEYGPTNFKRAYRMSWSSFRKLNHKLAPYLDKSDRVNCINGPILPELRLSIALRYFAGASMWDILISHGVSRTEAYNSIWEVVDAVNEIESFDISYPSCHIEQERIAAEFKKSPNVVSKIVQGVLTVCYYGLKDQANGYAMKLE